MTIGLCRISLLRVIAPHTAWAISDISDQIGLGRVNAKYAVDVRFIDHVHGKSMVVVTLCLVSTGQVMWCDQIELADLMMAEMYNVITAIIVRSLIQNIEKFEVAAFNLTATPGSYAYFLKGHASLGGLDLARLRKGRQDLQRAFSLAPGFAPAASAVARSYQLEWILTARGDKDLLDRSEHYARIAIDADPYEARGYRELGFSQLYKRQFDSSIEQYSRAELLNPQYADLLADFADALIHDGQIHEALKKMKRAMDLNPICQDTYYWTLGAAHYCLEDYDQSIQAIVKMKDKTPALRLLAAAYALKGDGEQASRCRVKAMEVYPDMTIEMWTQIVPFRDQRQIKHYAKGLQLAGFP